MICIDVAAGGRLLSRASNGVYLAHGRATGVYVASRDKSTVRKGKEGTKAGTEYPATLYYSLFAVVLIRRSIVFCLNLFDFVRIWYLGLLSHGLRLVPLF